MARAKRTDRAEARRRHRAEAAARAAATGEAGEPGELEPDAPPAPKSTKPAPPPPPARPSLGSAFRTAFRPIDLRSDLAYLPRLLRHKSVLIPVALSVAATFLSLSFGAASQAVVLPSASPGASASASPGASASPSSSPAPSPSPAPSASASASPAPSGSPSPSASPSGSPAASPSPGGSPSPSPSAAPGLGQTGGVVGFVGDTLFQFFVVPPPVAAAFIAGFLAPRASYLAGLITGLVSVACLAVVAFSIPGIDPRARDAVIQQALVLSTGAGALYAAAAAWYKRFLNLANPNRARGQQPRRSNQRPVRSRSPQRRR